MALVDLDDDPEDVELVGIADQLGKEQRLAAEVGGQRLSAVMLDGRLHLLSFLPPQSRQDAFPPQNLDAQPGMVHAPSVVVRAVFGELREAADVVEQGDRLGNPLLVLVEREPVGQQQNLLACPPGVLALHPQMRVNVFILVEKAARIGVEPTLEIVQRIRLHRRSVPNQRQKESGQSTEKDAR